MPRPIHVNIFMFHATGALVVETTDGGCADVGADFRGSTLARDTRGPAAVGTGGEGLIVVTAIAADSGGDRPGGAGEEMVKKGTEGARGVVGGIHVPGVWQIHGQEWRIACGDFLAADEDEG